MMPKHHKGRATTTEGPESPPAVALPDLWRASAPLADAFGIAFAALPTQRSGRAILWAIYFGSTTLAPRPYAFSFHEMGLHHRDLVLIGWRAAQAPT